MTSDQIRETFLEFFAARDHKRLASASLVPAAFDPSVLLTTAGMHPLKPYFLGVEQPPHHRLTSCQKCFRTPDIDVVGTTTRHLTCFEMLGNFSLGDYFKQGAVEFAWELAREGFGFDEEKIWVTVFEGDAELGLGPDEEAIAAWEAIGVPRERIVLCPRSENFWQAGPTGPCGPCSELYLDRGLDFGRPDDLPGGDNERFLEFWNLVFMQYDQNPVGTLTPLPNQNIDTGMGLNRMACILQGVETVFETDQFAPLIELGEELSGKRYGDDHQTDVALRILADHTRGMTFLLGDGVVPSNEDRGYVLRRIMRRAIARAHLLGVHRPDPAALPGGRHRHHGRGLPRAGRAPRGDRDVGDRGGEVASGARVENGLVRLEELAGQARGRGDEGVGAEELFKLHDTYGFPIDLSRELLGEQGLGSDEEGFEALMDEQRERSRAGGGSAAARIGGRVALTGPPAEFIGYDTLEADTDAVLVAGARGRRGAGQARALAVLRGGRRPGLRRRHGRGRHGFRADVVDVVRSGDDQALLVRPVQGELQPGAHVVARVDRATRNATMANHTATHLLHAALRQRLGTHVRQAGSYVGPDKLRFDFTHGAPLSPQERRDVEDQVNAWIVENWPVTLAPDVAGRGQGRGRDGAVRREVRRRRAHGRGRRRVLLARAVRRHARRLDRGDRPVRASPPRRRRRPTCAASRRSPAPRAIALLRRHDGLLAEAADALRTRPEDVPAKLVDLQTRLKQAAKGAAKPAATVDVDALIAAAEAVDGTQVLTARVDVSDNKALLDVLDRVKEKVGAVVLGAVGGKGVILAASVTPALVERGLKAGDIVKLAAQVTGGNGGGRPTHAVAGGPDAGKLDEALGVAREAIERQLSPGQPPRGRA